MQRWLPAALPAKVPVSLPASSSSAAIARPSFIRRRKDPNAPPQIYTLPTIPTRDGTAATSTSSSTLVQDQAQGSALKNKTYRVDEHGERIYTDRKAFLYNMYSQILRQSNMVLLFSHNNLATKDLNKIRAAIKAVPLPVVAFDPSSSAAVADPSSPSSTPTAPAPTPKPQFTLMRTGVFSAVCKSHLPQSSFHPWLVGQTATLSFPSLSPLYIQRTLAAVRKAVKECVKSRDGDGDANSTSAPKLNLIVALVDGRLVGAQELESIAKLPELDTLRGHVVGMLEQQGQSLLRVLSQAGGGGLVNTLKGLEKDLQDKEAGGSSPS
jgi:large subunit ribosomal protein L10